MHVQAVAALLRNSESSTADTVAAVRALHQRQPVRIFEDPYAHALTGLAARKRSAKPTGIEALLDAGPRPVEACGPEAI